MVPPTDLIADLFNALDKGNLGNAETKGLSKGMANLAHHHV